MKTLCLIPARGGSRRVPLKNILPICGRPCLDWSVDAIREATSPLRTVLLTDHPRIAEKAREIGLEVIDEPAWLAGSADIDDVDFMSYALNELDDKSDPFDCILVQYACVPVKPKGYVDAALSMLASTGADIIQPVALIPPQTHPYRAVCVNLDGRTAALIAGGPARMSQDFPPMYVVTAAGVTITTKALRTLKARGLTIQDESLGLDRRAFIHAADDCIDIDTSDDIAWAEYRLHKSRMSCLH